MLYQLRNSRGIFYFEMMRYNNFNFELHMHRHFELVYVREGEITVTLNYSKEVVKQGECAFIPENTPHSYCTTQSSVADVCIFSAGFVPFFIKKIKGKRPASCKFTCKKSITDFMLEELFLENHIPDIFIIKSTLYAISGEILKNINFQVNDTKQGILLDKLIEYVSLHFAEEISLDKVASALGYEKHYLSKCFHCAIPMHFTKYVNMLRIDAAIEMLQSTDRTITEIALSSGFQSVRSFNRVFLENTGKTPKEYMLKVL